MENGNSQKADAAGNATASRAGSWWSKWNCPAREQEEKEREEFAKELEARLPDWMTSQGKGHGKTWLRILYEDYQQRWQALDALIWKIAAIALPISLAPYAVVSAGVGSRWQILALALFSMVVMSLWYIASSKLYCENQRWLNRIWAIERRVGIYEFARPFDQTKEPIGPWPKLRKPMKWFGGRGVIQQAFTGVWLVNALLWFVIICFGAFVVNTGTSHNKPNAAAKQHLEGPTDTHGLGKESQNTNARSSDE